MAQGGNITTPTKVLLASPRGFCAGVERAIRTVEDALAHFGAPVYVRHEIVHNAHVVARLKAMGAVFVEEIAEIDASRPVVFSAHGAPRKAYLETKERGLTAIDATCPLVLKVHNEARRHVDNRHHVVLIGHAGHPEVIGTMGHVRPDMITLIESIADAENLEPPEGPLAYVTQTTLSVDDTAEIIAVLQRRFPKIVGPRRSDICYATTNRQDAVKKIAPGADLVLVVGSPQSSNSVRLVETALQNGAKHAMLVDDPANADLSQTMDARIIGVTAGASAPEDLVEILLRRIAESRPIVIENITAAQESMTFKQPLMMAG